MTSNHPKLRNDPEAFERVVSAALLVTLGADYQDVAKAVGIHHRTLHRWRRDDELWAEACNQATERWLAGISQMAKQKLAEKLADGDVTDDLVLTVLERTVPQFAEGPKRHEVAVAGRIQHEQRDPRELLAERLNLIEARSGTLPPAESEPERKDE